MSTPAAPVPAPPVPAPHVGPMPVERRAVAPDVARGLALLGIAVANSVIHVWGGPVGAGMRPADGSTLDRVVDGIVTLFVDRRTMPMFALLYGYGIGVVLRRRATAGVPWPTARGDLLRRGGVLAAFGLVHIVLLFEGDILASYGLTGLLAVAFVRASGRTTAIVGAVALGISGVAMGVTQALNVWAMQADGTGAGVDFLAGSEESLLGSLVFRLMAGFGAPLGVLPALPMVLLGMWLARGGVLENPAAHVVRLRRWAVGGLAVSVLGGVPMALAVSRVWEPGPWGLVIPGTVHEITGAAGGLAFAALVAWVVAVRGTTVATLGPVGKALRAVGTRSLSCYLLQSVLFVLPLRGWAGGLGEGMSSAQVVAWAVGVWLVGVAFAVVLERAGRRGPAEALYRRLVYRAPGGATPPVGTPTVSPARG